MDNLYVRTSYGAGNFVKGKGIISSELREFSENKFETLVWGTSVDPLKAKSSLFPCRDIIASISGLYIGKNRGNLPASHLDEACRIADYDGEVKDLIIVDFMSVDDSIIDTVKTMLVNNLFYIIENEVKTHFNTSDNVVICIMDYDDIKSHITSLEVTFEELDDCLILRG